MLSVKKFLKFHFNEVMSLSLVCFYGVMLLKCCLKLLALALARL
jgi:hypothetical protein